MASPRSEATSTTASQHGQQEIDDLNVQWDQTYLRLNYILGSLGGPVVQHLSETSKPASASATSSSSSSSSPSSSSAKMDHKPLPTAVSPATAEPSHSRPTRPPVFPGLTLSEAARKLAQIGTWRDEVADAADAALCGCSASLGTRSLAAHQPPCSVTQGLLPAVLLAGSLASPPAVSRRARRVCAVCSCPDDDADPRMHPDDPQDWAQDTGPAKKALRKVQDLMRMGRRKPQLSPTSAAASVKTAKPPPPPPPPPAPIRDEAYPTDKADVTAMYHHYSHREGLGTGNDDNDGAGSSDSSSSSSGVGRRLIARAGRKKPPVSRVAQRQQLERAQQLKQARLLRAQALLNRSSGAAAMPQAMAVPT